MAFIHAALHGAAGHPAAPEFNREAQCFRAQKRGDRDSAPVACSHGTTLLLAQGQDRSARRPVSVVSALISLRLAL